MAVIENESLRNIFGDRPLMAILRGMGVQKSLSMARQAWDLGIDCVEVPIQSAEDVDALRAVVEAGAALGKPVGAGTVVSLDTVRQASAAGAAFTVSPGYDFAVARASFDAGMPPLPGVASATEIQTAMAAGLTWLKAFPATTLGPEWFSMMRGPFPMVKFVATGGLDADNAGRFLAGGVRVVAVGSALADSTQLPRLTKLLSHGVRPLP